MRKASELLPAIQAPLYGYGCEGPQQSTCVLELDGEDLDAQNLCKAAYGRQARPGAQRLTP